MKTAWSCLLVLGLAATAAAQSSHHHSDEYYKAMKKVNQALKHVGLQWTDDRPGNHPGIKIGGKQNHLIIQGGKGHKPGEPWHLNIRRRGMFGNDPHGHVPLSGKNSVITRALRTGGPAAIAMNLAFAGHDVYRVLNGEADLRTVLVENAVNLALLPVDALVLGALIAAGPIGWVGAVGYVVARAYLTPMLTDAVNAGIDWAERGIRDLARHANGLSLALRDALGVLGFGVSKAGARVREGFVDVLEGLGGK